MIDIIKQLLPFRDVRGAIVQKDMDGGDSAYRHALLVCLLKFAGEHAKAKTEYTLLLHNCHISSGLWRRHWDMNKWYSNWNNFSRDQWQKVFLASALMKDYGMMLQMLMMQILRFGFHQNVHKGTDCEALKCYKIPDLPGVSEVIILLRAFPLIFTLLFAWRGGFTWYSFLYYYGALHVVDLSYLADLYFRKKQTWDYDSLMCVELMYSTKRLPTLVSYLAKEKYKKTDFNVRINHNYCATDNDICPLGVYYNIVAHEIFNKQPLKGL